VSSQTQIVEADLVAPVLRQLREALNRLRERELAGAMKRIPGLTPTQRTAVERFSETLMSEFMHSPSARLTAASANDCESDVVEAARYLFALR
jgi:glutamyl-tRNA reductase